MLYGNVLLFLGLASTALASPLEVRAKSAGTVAALEKLSGGKPLPWVNKGKFEVLKVSPADMANVRGALHTRDVSLAPENVLEARQGGETVSSLKAGCYKSGSWALSKVMVPLITSICSEGALSFFQDAGSAQFLRFRGLVNEAGHEMSVVAAFESLVDGIFSPVDAGVCTTMATALILNNCQGKNADTRGGWITAKNLQGQDAARLTIDPTTANCNC